MCTVLFSLSVEKTLFIPFLFCLRWGSCILFIWVMKCSKPVEIKSMHNDGAFRRTRKWIKVILCWWTCDLGPIPHVPTELFSKQIPLSPTYQFFVSHFCWSSPWRQSCCCVSHSQMNDWFNKIVVLGRHMRRCSISFVFSEQHWQDCCVMIEPTLERWVVSGKLSNMNTSRLNKTICKWTKENDPSRTEKERPGCWQLNDCFAGAAPDLCGKSCVGKSVEEDLVLCLPRFVSHSNANLKTGHT